MEIHPNETYALEVEEDDEDGFHHVARNLKTGEKICSKQSRIQHTRIDKNDVLCQSYSLYKVFSAIPLTKYKVQKQYALINMYRSILKDDVFIGKLNEEILGNTENAGLWKIFRKNVPTRQNVSMKKETLLKNVHRVLDDWEQFGYNYFIGNGK